MWIRLLKKGLWRILMQEAGILLFLMTMEVEKQGMCPMENSWTMFSMNTVVEIRTCSRLTMTCYEEQNVPWLFRDQ